jgi:hypothetical protein
VTGTELPWLQRAVILRLVADATFSERCGGRCSDRLPDDLTAPAARVLLVGNLALNAAAGAWSPLIQVEGWCGPAGFGGDDPAVVAWRIAARAAWVLARVRNAAHETMHWSARVVDGPVPDIDKSLGESTPLYRAFIRTELLIHNR